MMIKCQKCGFENQMGSIFCRECGEKLDMDAIDPNKLQKDVAKEKSVKLAKKRIKEAISTGFGLLVVVAFLGVVFYNGGLRKYEEPEVNDTAANQKYNAAATGSAVGKVKYTYPEVNRMLKLKVVDPISEIPSFAKITNAEVAYDEEKNQPVIYLWISLKDKVPVNYTIHGDIIYNTPSEDADVAQSQPLSVDVKRLDIGRLPLFISTHTFLNGFQTLLENDEMMNFFARAKNVEFTAEGMTVDFSKTGPTSAASPAPKASASAGVAALKGGSAAVDEEAAERKRQQAEEKKRKAEEAAEKKKQEEEERKRKIEEYNEKKKQEAEERKRKAEEERERKRQEKEERERQIREENERRRQEREDRRNNNYNNNRSSRRSSRNRY